MDLTEKLQAIADRMLGLPTMFDNDELATMDQALTALRARAEGEPVGWLYRRVDVAREGYAFDKYTITFALEPQKELRGHRKWTETPLYAHPAPSGMVDASYKSLYEELLLAVGKKWPNETRHQTALRYIQNAEAHQDNRACAAAPVAGKGKETK